MGGFALIWVISRAHLQSVTVDEADSYLQFVAPAWASQWYPSSGNHVLNSILIRLFTWLFGLSHLTLRAPALIGGAVYMVAVFRLCLLMTEEELFVWPLFVSFVYNPFVMDYMVAARGYGLAVGFLMMEIFLLARQIVTYEPGGEAALRRDCMMASVCAALSFAANFSFAYADGSGILVFWVWACWKMWTFHGRSCEAAKKCGRLLAWCVAPGFLVAFLVVGSAVISYPKSQLYYGARQLSETWKSVVDSCFSGLNTAIVNPLLARILQNARDFLPWLAVVLCVLEFVVPGWPRSSAKRSRLLQVAAFGGGVVVLTLTLHWLQFKVARVPLPMYRTALFFAPLTMVVWGAVTAAEKQNRAGRILQRLSLVVWFVGAAYFVGSLRLMHFFEWSSAADVRAAYPVIQEVAQRYGVRDIPTAWDYASALNFYRVYFHESNLKTFCWTLPPPRGKEIYVLPYDNFQDFIRTEGLHILYRGERTQLTILARGHAPER